MRPPDDAVVLEERVTTWARTELAARAGASMPDLGVARAFSLPRARVEAAATRGVVSVRGALAAVRSGGESGYIGLDGESLVPAVQVAEARVVSGAWTLAAGVVDDPWVRSGDAAWGLRGVAPGVGEDLGWMDASDMGAWAGWRSPVARARLLMTSGEGARMRERDEAKNATAFVELTPGALHLAGFARAGTRGIGSARDHRAGVRVAGALGPLSLGAEGLAAWGVGGDGIRQPIAASVWGVVRPWRTPTDSEGVVGWLRVDVATEAPGDADARTLVLRGGLGLEVGSDGGTRVVLGAAHRAIGAGVRGVAGAPALATTTEGFVQLEVALDTRARGTRDPLP